MTATPTFQRTPLVISAGNLVAGPVHATFREGDRESLLHSYLVLVRQLRGQPRVPTITLRSSDISAIAEHLGASEERVLDDLLDRMGATRAQRKALAAMFVAGALTIVATGSIALEFASGVFADDSGAADGVPAAEVAEQATPIVADAATVAAVVTTAPAEVETAVGSPAMSWPDPELAIAGDGAAFEMMIALQRLSLALAEPVPEDGATSEGTGVTDDGTVVATGRPPAPVVEGVGVADDGSTVAVAPPPAPPEEGVGIADDGSTVAVAPPPAPPTGP